MADQNLRDHVLNTTSHLQQQLLKAVDRLEQRGGRDRPGTAAGTGNQSSASGGGSRLGTARCMILHYLLILASKYFIFVTYVTEC